MIYHADYRTTRVFVTVQRRQRVDGDPSYRPHGNSYVQPNAQACFEWPSRHVGLAESSGEGFETFPTQEEYSASVARPTSLVCDSYRYISISLLPQMFPGMERMVASLGTRS
jgi:hypothetical protein